MTLIKLLPLGLFLALPLQAATTLTVTPTKDSFNNAATPTLNYGAAGALNISGSATSKGADDTFMTFDVTSIINGFNSTFGAGNWTITDARLLLTEKSSPGNAIFNTNASGNFEIRWITNDSYAQGTGNPGATTIDGISWGTENTFLTPGTDASLGTTFNYTSTASNTQQQYVLPLTNSSFFSDLNTAGPVSFYLTAGSGSTAFTFLSTDYTGASPPFATSRPLLQITAVPEPSHATLLLSGLGVMLGCRRRRVCRHP